VGSFSINAMSIGLLPAIAPLASALMTFVLLRWLLSSALARHFADHPNDRSLHTQPVPRSGGVAIMGGIAAATLMVNWGWLAIALALSLSMISLIDDWRGLPVTVRLAGHCAASLLLMSSLHGGMPWWLFTVVLIFLLWMTNLYNFMDGSDGLAGGMTFFGFTSYALAARFAGELHLALLCASIATAAAAFLVYNFHPARMFMGDGGSVPVGFLAGALGLIGYTDGVWPLWFPALVFAPFVFDASVTLALRLKRREAIWLPHRKHYYQRMVRIGWGHASVAVGNYLVMALTGAIALAALSWNPGTQAWAIALVLGTYTAIAMWFDRRWSKSEAGGQP